MFLFDDIYKKSRLKSHRKDFEAAMSTSDQPFEGGDGVKWDGAAALAKAASADPPEGDCSADGQQQADDEQILEELLRLKLTSSAVVPEVTSASLLPPKQRIKLFQPRTKMEQFEDILIESQLFESSPELASSAVETLALAGLPADRPTTAAAIGAATFGATVSG